MSIKQQQTITPAHKCEWCGTVHAFKCPLVKRAEMDKDGTLTAVEFFTPRELQIRLDPFNRGD